MSERPETAPERRHHVLIVPVLVWAALMALLLASLGYSYLPGAPLKLLAGLAVAITKAGLIAAIYMELREASPLVRVAAACGLGWLSLLFIFSFADFLTR